MIMIPGICRYIRKSLSHITIIGITNRMIKCAIDDERMMETFFV